MTKGLVCFWLCMSLTSLAEANEHDLGQQLHYISRNITNPRAAVGLWSLRSYWTRVGKTKRDAIDLLLQKLIDNRKAPMGTRRLATWLAADFHAKANRDNLARVMQQRLGWVQDWQITQAYPDSSQHGFEHVYPPEESDFSSVVWRKFPQVPTNGIIKLHPLFEPNTDIVVYAASAFQLSKTTTLVFHLGCDDACKLWLDGQLLAQDPGRHSLALDQSLFSAQVPAGSHQILIKVVQAKGAMEFQLGITNTSGNVLRELKVIQPQTKAQSPRTQKTFTKLQRLDSLSDWFEQQAKTQPQNLVRQAEAAWALYHSSNFDRAQRKLDFYLDKAVEVIQPEIYPWLVRLADIAQDENQTRELLEKASQLIHDQSSPWAHLGLLYQIRGQSLKALRYFKQALQRNPNDLDSSLGKAEIYFDLGLFAQAKKMIQSLLQRYQDVPDVVMVAASLLRRAKKHDQAIRLFEKLMTLQSDNTLGIRALHELYLDRGDLNRALHWLDKAIELDPLRKQSLLQKSRLLRSNGQPSKALQEFQTAKNICPTDPNTWVELGETYLLLGRDLKAKKAFAHALGLTPQNRQLQRRTQVLTPGKKTFWAQWQIDPLQFLNPQEKQQPTTKTGAVRLYDNRVVQIHPNGMAAQFRQQIIRILDEQGVLRFRAMRVEYAPSRQDVRILQSRIWHRDGQSDADILLDDYSLSEPWYNLYYDIHAREITFPSIKPGDLIELTTLVEDTGDSALLKGYFGDLVTLQFRDPVVQLRYVLLSPPEHPLAFEQSKQISHSKHINQDGTAYHVWQAQNLPGIDHEPAMPGYTETHAYLHLSTMTSWAELAKWFGARISNQMQAGPEVSRLAHQLTSGCEDPIDKIRAIYRYVADRTRYVALEFGIHSYIPYQASQVLTRKFGDCKDKATLMIALFQSIGIRAQLALVRMLRLGQIKLNQQGGPASLAVFNHAICYLPDYNLWLDGTAAMYDVGELPNQVQGVTALVVDRTNYKLTKTPQSDAQRNQTKLKLVIDPQPDNTKLNLQLSLSGSMAPQMRIRLMSSANRSEVLQQLIHEIFPSANIYQSQVIELADPSKPVLIQAKLGTSQLVQNRFGTLELPVLGKEINYQHMLAGERKRTFDLVLGPAWSVQFKVTIRLPKEYRLASPQNPQAVTTPFGTAQLRLIPKLSTLEARAELVLKDNRILASQYEAFRGFLGKVDKLLGLRIQLTRVKQAEQE